MEDVVIEKIIHQRLKPVLFLTHLFEIIKRRKDYFMTAFDEANCRQKL